MLVKCPEKEVWSQYWDGQVSSDQSSVLSEHLRTCALCMDLAAEEERFQQLLQCAVKTEILPDGWQARIQTKAMRRRQLSVCRSGLVPIGIMIAAICLGLWMGWNEIKNTAELLPILLGSGWWFEIPALILSLLEYVVRAAWKGGTMLPSLVLLVLSLVVVQFIRMKGVFRHA